MAFTVFISKVSLDVQINVLSDIFETFFLTFTICTIWAYSTTENVMLDDDTGHSYYSYYYCYYYYIK